MKMWMMLVAGALAVVASPALAISTVRLKRAKQKRRYLKYQMHDLESALP